MNSCLPERIMLFRGRDHPGKVVVRKNAAAVGWACVSGAVGEMLTSAVCRQSFEGARQDLRAELSFLPAAALSQSPFPRATERLHASQSPRHEQFCAAAGSLL